MFRFAPTIVRAATLEGLCPLVVRASELVLPPGFEAITNDPEAVCSITEWIKRHEGERK